MRAVCRLGPSIPAAASSRRPRKKGDCCGMERKKGVYAETGPGRQLAGFSQPAELDRPEKEEGREPCSQRGSPERRQLHSQLNPTVPIRSARSRSTKSATSSQEGRPIYCFMPVLATSWQIGRRIQKSTQIAVERQVSTQYRTEHGPLSDPAAQTSEPSEQAQLSIPAERGTYTHLCSRTQFLSPLQKGKGMLDIRGSHGIRSSTLPA